MVTTPGEKNISIKLNDDFISRLDKIAGIGNLSRHQLAKNIIEVGIEELETLKRIGVFQLGILIRNLTEKRIKPKDTASGEKPIPIKLDDNFIDRLDKLASKAELSRHQLMKNLLQVGLEEVEAFAKIGAIRLAVIIRDLPKSLRKICDMGEVALRAAEQQ